MAPDPSSTAPSVPNWLRTIGGTMWYLVGAGLVVWGLAELAQKLTVALLPVLVALLATGVLHPVVARVDRRGWPSWVAPLLAVLAMVILVVGMVGGVGVRLNDQLPVLQQDLRSAAQDIEDRFGLELPAMGGSGEGSGSGSSSIVPDATELLRLGSEVLFGLFLSLALTFLFLKDGASIWEWFVTKLRGRARDDVDAAARAAWGTVGAYVRGLTVVAAFDAVGIAVGLVLLGVPLVITLAVLQFVASYIPTIGAFVAGAVAVAVAYSSGGFATAALTVALVVVVQQIGNNVIEPWIMGRTIPLHPAVVLIAVTAGAALWGIAGALLFVPLAAALSAAGHALWVRRTGADPATG
ncbi:AI-2E family transporter [Acidimicrobiia bacterium EGI L10123]|uniref:AI-2E family transporter n=1 Tax=Salinilacustrithrix flava TaxID=2957203 RepID=UPI003D7C1564|nr:AI-2E family transporter [Acidimicrobiia bacterium EGI L10123]